MKKTEIIWAFDESVKLRCAHMKVGDKLVSLISGTERDPE